MRRSVADGLRAAPLAVIIGFAPAALASAQFVLIPVANASSEGLGGICLGPDGNIWYTVGNRIGRATPSGALTEFELPTAGSRPGDIVAGPDGNLWFLEGAAPAVGRISPAGSITEYPIPAPNAAPTIIVVGPDGALWFSDYIRRSIWRMDSPGTFTEYPALASANGLARGSDGNLWFTVFDSVGPMGRMTLSGAVTLFPRPTNGFGWRCGLGPDGNVWYTTGRAFGRVTPTGAITEFPLSSDRGHVPTAVASGSYGNLWMPVDETFACFEPCTPAPVERDGILHVSTGGSQTRYELAAEFQIADGSKITAGPDGSMWFTARNGLVRFFPADLQGPTPTADIPTVGDIGRAALLGLLALAGLALLRR